MKTQKFKTTIKCSGCVATVTPFLNAALGSGNWKVDLNDPAKTLVVTGEFSEAVVTEAMKKAGYSATPA